MLHALFYAEFDNTLGPVVLFDAPKGSVSDSVGGSCLFDAISDYSITGPQLSGHLITVSVPKSAFKDKGSSSQSNTPTNNESSTDRIVRNLQQDDNDNQHQEGDKDSEMQVVNFPLAIGSHEAGRHYHRNALLFNVGFILSNKNVPSQLFSASLRRLALTLRAMEIESAFLSNPKTKVALDSLLAQLLHDFNTYGESTITLDSANVLSLKLPSSYPITKQSSSSQSKLSQTSRNSEEKDKTTGSKLLGVPFLYKEQRLLPEVLEHHVPSLLVPCGQLMEVDWDLSIHRVLPYIDGVKCVKVIALEADVDVGCCQDSLAVLLWHECCCLLDMFQYSNMYALRPGAKRLFGSFCYSTDSKKPIITEWTVDTVEHITARQKGSNPSTNNKGQGVKDQRNSLVSSDSDEDEGELGRAPPPPPPTSSSSSSSASFASSSPSSLPLNTNMVIQKSTLQDIPMGDVLSKACDIALSMPSFNKATSITLNQNQNQNQNSSSLQSHYRTSPLRTHRKFSSSSSSFDLPHSNSMNNGSMGLNSSNNTNKNLPMTGGQTDNALLHQSVSGEEVLSFYTAFASGFSVRDVVCSSKEKFKKFEHRQLIAYGILNGILQRIHVFPICELPEETLTSVLNDAFIASSTHKDSSPNHQSEQQRAHHNTSSPQKRNPNPVHEKNEKEEGKQVEYFTQKHHHKDSDRVSGSRLSQAEAMRSHLPRSKEDEDSNSVVASAAVPSSSSATMEETAAMLRKRSPVRAIDKEVMRSALVMMDGEHSLDEIGCSLFLSETQIRSIAELVNSVAPTNQDAICFIYK